MGEPTFYLFHDNPPISLSPGAFHRVKLVTPKLESDLPLRQLEAVARTFEPTTFVVWMRSLFGADIPRHSYEALGRDLRNGAVQMPRLVLAANVPRGALAAYDAEQQRALYAHALIKRALDPADSNGKWLLVAALLEEFGHHVDWLLRNQYSSVGGDADMDEGAKFAYAILNLQWTERQEAQVARLVYPFGPRPIDAAWQEYGDEVKPWVDSSEQQDEDRWRQYEFFGAGEGSGDPSRSFGHASIEHALTRVFHPGKKPSDPEVKEFLAEIYFGNWLRDVSQAITPDSLKVFSRDFYTKALDLKGRQRFGDKPHFKVTREVLGVYRTEEHLDNPSGLKDGRPADSELNAEPLRDQSKIDDVTHWMQNHLCTPLPGCVSAFESIEKYVKKSLGTAGPERHRHLGAALHAVEDYYAHSNFVEVMLHELGHTSVFAWCGKSKVTRDGKQAQVHPIVTGTFGSADTSASLLLMVGEWLHEAIDCSSTEPSASVEIARLALTDFRPAWGAAFGGLLDWRREYAQYFVWLDRALCLSTAALAALIRFTIGGAVRMMGNAIDDAQTAFFVDRNSFNPTHSQLAKDHDDHPLHVVAAECAQIAIEHVAGVVKRAWAGQASVGDVMTAVRAMMIHPAHIEEHAPGWALRTKIAEFAKGNPTVVQRLTYASWVDELSQSREWAEMRKRADALSDGYHGAEQELANARAEGLEAYARRRAMELGDLFRKQLHDIETSAHTTLDGYQELVKAKQRELAQQGVTGARAQLEAVVGERLHKLEARSYSTWSAFSADLQREYGDVRREDVRARYAEAAKQRAQAAQAAVQKYVDEQVPKLEAEAKARRERVLQFVQDFEPTEVLAEKVAQIRDAIDAQCDALTDEARRLQADVAKHREAVTHDFQDPLPKTDFEVLLESELAALEQKTRAAAEVVSSKLHDPKSAADVQAFARQRTEALRKLVRDVLEDGAATKDLEGRVKGDLDRLGAPLDGSARGLPSHARGAAADVKPKVQAAGARDTDLQLDYVRGLDPKTRGIEAGERK